VIDYYWDICCYIGLSWWWNKLQTWNIRELRWVRLENQNGLETFGKNWPKRKMVKTCMYGIQITSLVSKSTCCFKDQHCLISAVSYLKNAIETVETTWSGRRSICAVWKKACMWSCLKWNMEYIMTQLVILSSFQRKLVFELVVFCLMRNWYFTTFSSYCKRFTWFSWADTFCLHSSIFPA